jgi:hypothetical protein
MICGTLAQSEFEALVDAKRRLKHETRNEVETSLKPTGRWGETFHAKAETRI